MIDTTSLYSYSLTSSPSMILRSDGMTIPVDVGNVDYQAYLKWLAKGYTPSPVEGVTLTEVILDLSSQVDQLVAAIYSQWSRFQQEYLLRQQAAQDYSDRGYQGDPGVWVTSFSNAAGITAKQGAVLILKQAQGLNGALAALAAQRMRKYQIAASKSIQDAETVFASIIADIKLIASQIS